MMSEAEEVKPDLPEGWVWTNLENCVEILDCQRIPINAKDRETRKGEIPYYGATGQTGWIDDYLFDEELVLLGEDGAPFLDPLKNKSYIISGKSWVNNHAHVLKAINGLTINHFILHYLNIFHYEDYVSGTTRLKLNQAPMKKIPIPLAPLPEQRRIVARIEELYRDKGVPLIFVRNIRSATFEGPDTRYISHQKAEELRAHKVESGDILITKMGEPPGDACIRE